MRAAARSPIIARVALSASTGAVSVPLDTQAPPPTITPSASNETVSIVHVLLLQLLLFRYMVHINSVFITSGQSR